MALAPKRSTAAEHTAMASACRYTLPHKSHLFGGPIIQEEKGTVQKMIEMRAGKNPMEVIIVLFREEGRGFVFVNITAQVRELWYAIT